MTLPNFVTTSRFAECVIQAGNQSGAYSDYAPLGYLVKHGLLTTWYNQCAAYLLAWSQEEGHNINSIKWTDIKREETPATNKTLSLLHKHFGKRD